MWKAFATWRKSVRSRKISRCRKTLKENLFYLHPDLGKALLEIKEGAENISENELMTGIDPSTTYTLEEFQGSQLGKMGIVSYCVVFVNYYAHVHVHVLLFLSSVILYVYMYILCAKCM